MKRQGAIMLLLLLLIMVFTLTGCSAMVEGTYSGMGPLGLPVTMTLRDGTVQTNMLLGLPINGTYKVRGQYLELTFNSYGMNETITGKLSGNQIIFADMTLTK